MRDDPTNREHPIGDLPEAEELGKMLEPLRSYHEPGETPREEMWQAIAARIGSEAPVESPALEAAGPGDGSGAAPPHVSPHVSPHVPRDVPTDVPTDAPTGIPAGVPGVVPLARARRRLTRPMPWLGWAAAASVVLLIGVAVGRSTAPDAPAPEDAPVAAGEPAGTPASTIGLELALRRHLGRTESLLTVVRTDGRQGRVDPAAASWARGLLTQTRLLIDARAGGDPALVALLQDLELVLAEIVVVTQAGALDGSRARTELELMLRALELSSVLPRLQAACSGGCTAPAV